MIYVLSLILSVASADVINIKPIIEKGMKIEKTNPGTLLKQITMKPAKDSTRDNPRFEVMKIEKGSIYEREGVKVGDIVTTTP